MRIGDVHSISLSGKDLYNTFGLIAAERPSINPPTLKTTFVELPGNSESVDCSTMLRGVVPYGQRTGSWKFYLDPDWPMANTGELRKRKNNGTLWAYVYGSLINYIHGRTHTIVLTDTPNVEYTGRVTISSWQSQKDFSYVTLSYSIDPPIRD